MFMIKKNPDDETSFNLWYSEITIEDAPILVGTFHNFYSAWKTKCEYEGLANGLVLTA